MSNVVPVEELLKRRIYKARKAGFKLFFTKVGFINKTTEFTMSKLGKCELYYPLTNINVDAHATSAKMVEDEYKWLQDNISK